MRSFFRSLAIVVTVATTAACAQSVQAEPGAGGFEAPAIRTIDVEQLDKARKDGTAKVLIDVRTPQEFAEGHVPGARNIPLDQIGAHADQLPGDEEIYLVCRSGSRSARAASVLSAKGVKTVNVAGGTMAWLQAGKAVE